MLRMMVLTIIILMIIPIHSNDSDDSNDSNDNNDGNDNNDEDTHCIVIVMMIVRTRNNGTSFHFFNELCLGICPTDEVHKSSLPGSESLANVVRGPS
jgi:hypothetical protein